MAQRRANFNKENLLRKVEEPKGKSHKKKFKFDPDNDPFILRTGNERTEYAKNLVVPSMLMSELLFENTVTMLFAETGLGKTLLAVQIVDALSRGKSILGLENEAEPLITLYVDMENGESVHRARYSASAKDDRGKRYYFDEYQWSDNCHFLDLATSDKYCVPKKDAIDWWFDLITYKADVCKAKVIVVDNLFAIISHGGIESTKEAAPILSRLYDLKSSKGLTIIVVHHTPKRMHGAITRNDVAGSSNLTNLVDGAVAIGKSSYGNSEHSRYIKQIKPSRYSAEVFGERNVIPCRTEKLAPNFIGFSRIELSEDEANFRYEDEHLTQYDSLETKAYTKDAAEERRELITEYAVSNPDITKKDLADYFKVTRPTLDKDIKKIESSGGFNGQLFNNRGE